MITSSTAIATYELSTPVANVVLPVATVVIPAAIDFFKKDSLKQINPSDILHNMIE
jgi:hypothetical protein